MESTMTNFAHLRIPLKDVVKATNNFNHDNIIGHGGFSTTYKGQLLQSGRLTTIAAQRFDCKHREADLKFLMEISVLYDLKHTNVVSIIGFCDEKEEKIIVTTYEAHGSLGDHLKNLKLIWPQRLKISVGVACALSYLHYDARRDYAIIHCNINSDAILLNENWEAKLSGFDICIKQSVHNKDQDCLCEHTGTMGCIDPAIEKTGGVTYKSDIYSFGVVLFEILCGRKAFVTNEANRFLAPLARSHYENETLQDIVHPDIWNQMSTQSLFIYSRLAYSCLKEERSNRPNINDIVHTLEKALEYQLNNGKNLEHLKIRLSDIKLATNNFSETYRIAPFWDDYSLYRAELEHFDKENPTSEEGKNKSQHAKGRNTVVIKRYPSVNPMYTEEALFTDIEMLNNVKHHNIVTLLGFCVEGSEMILVTQNVSNGNLGCYLGKVNNMRILNWERRLKICIDVAHALKYIHYEMEDQKMIINCDIKSFNIGLDEKWGAKIIDFGSSIFLPPNQDDEALYLNKLFGTKFYMDPEYEKSGKLKRESDVYSFGVLLFEILCGRKVNDPIYLKESDKGLATVARQSFCARTLEDMIDPLIKEEASENNFVLDRGPNKDSLHTFMKIANQCVAETQDQRPTMKVVVKKLEKTLYLQENSMDNPRIPLEDIKQATKNFHDDNCIGGEGYGKFYKGNLPDGDEVNTIVAKRLDMRFGQRERQFFGELQILWEYKHKNFIGLVGYSDEHDEKIVVYEYASRRSLDKYLNDATLTWVKRLNICIDVASALDFIHGGVGKQAKVIHGDIKTANILLTHDWKAKVADFRLSIIKPITQEPEYAINHACGTPGYMDQLYEKLGFLTPESDIYSFAVVLFEILCGRSTIAIHEQEGHHLSYLIKNRFEKGKHDEVVFEQIREQIVPGSLNVFKEIAYRCLHHEGEKRPTTKTILTQLKRALEIQSLTIQARVSYRWQVLIAVVVPIKDIRGQETDRS
ncbi:uncharacterized protein LOC143610741 [Bidens hawaiensis]|uniref:uncharacterized protein LOC143610741 n=1 Tax=Bidens hawaiensis TaxID=980011 RepID=UPI0040496FA3